MEIQSVPDWVRLNLPGEFESLTLTALVCVKRLDRQINSLFIAMDSSKATVHWVIRHDGVLGFTVAPSKHQIAASLPVVSLEQLGTWVRLAVDGPRTVNALLDSQTKSQIKVTIKSQHL